MRRFPLLTQVAAPRSGVAQRTKLTGFSLFTREIQKKENVLKAKSLKQGSKENMQTVAKMWKNLPRRQRSWWNEKASASRKFRVSDVEKKNSAFNLVMRVFAQGDGALLNAGNEKFTSMVAKRTIDALTPKQENTVRAHFRLDTSKSALSKRKKGRKPNEEKKLASFTRMVMPDMRLFASFTEMQHAVAPTQEMAFVNVSQLRQNMTSSSAGVQFLKEKFKKLSPEEQDQFSPISQDEAPAFETFCAGKCTLLNPDRFDILSIFAEFRGIAKMPMRPNSAQIELYRSFAAMDRVRDGLYHKAHRILQRMQQCRSSDCGMYIANTAPSSTSVRPTAYAVDGGTLSDVDVARMLSETRMNQSVYDDVLGRAAVLRPHANQRVLEIYDVRGNVLRQLPVHLNTAKSGHSENVIIWRKKPPTKKCSVTHAPKKTRKVAGRARNVKTMTVAEPRHKKLDSAATKDKVSAKATKQRSRKAKVGKVARSNTIANKTAPRKLKISAKLSARAKPRNGGKKKSGTPTRLRATKPKAHKPPMKNAHFPPLTKDVDVLKGTEGAAPPAASSVAAKGKKVAAAVAPTAPEVQDEYSAMEESLINGDDDVSDYEAFDEFEGDGSVAATSDAKEVKATKPVKARKAKTSRNRHGVGARSLRSVAKILKRSKGPILLADPVRTEKPRSRFSSASIQHHGGSATASLLRKQLAGFL